MTWADETVLQKLEAQIAYNEKLLTELNEVVVAQSREIEELKSEIKVLGRQVLQITEGEVGSH